MPVLPGRSDRVALLLDMDNAKTWGLHRITYRSQGGRPRGRITQTCLHPRFSQDHQDHQGSSGIINDHQGSVLGYPAWPGCVPLASVSGLKRINSSCQPLGRIAQYTYTQSSATALQQCHCDRPRRNFCSQLTQRCTSWRMALQSQTPAHTASILLLSSECSIRVIPKQLVPNGHEYLDLLACCLLSSATGKSRPLLDHTLCRPSNGSPLPISASPESPNPFPSRVPQFPHLRPCTVAMADQSTTRLNETNAPLVTGIAIGFVCATAIFVTGRFYTRGVLLRSIGKDDWCMLIATVRSLVSLFLLWTGTNYHDRVSPSSTPLPCPSRQSTAWAGMLKLSGRPSPSSSSRYVLTCGKWPLKEASWKS